MTKADLKAEYLPAMRITDRTSPLRSSVVAPSPGIAGPENMCRRIALESGAATAVGASPRATADFGGNATTRHTVTRHTLAGRALTRHALTRHTLTRHALPEPRSARPAHAVARHAPPTPRSAHRLPRRSDRTWAPTAADRHFPTSKETTRWTP